MEAIRSSSSPVEKIPSGITYSSSNAIESLGRTRWAGASLDTDEISSSEDSAPKSTFSQMSSSSSSYAVPDGSNSDQERGSSTSMGLCTAVRSSGGCEAGRSESCARRDRTSGNHELRWLSSSTRDARRCAASSSLFRTWNFSCSPSSCFATANWSVRP